MKSAMLATVAVGLSVLLRIAPGLAQGPAAALGLTRSAAIGRVPHSVKSFDIDGLLDDPIWADALVVELGIETNPAENEPAPVHTDAYLVEDGTMLLVAFDAMDPDPTAIRAYLRDRDSAFNDDFVGVVVDTFNDERRAFEFFANAFGVQMDLTNDDVNGKEDASWNAIWDSAGAVNRGGYTVEMAIPFSQLRFPAEDGEQTWGIDVLRFYPRGERMRLSVTPLERGRNCYLCQIAKVRGFESAEAGLDLEVVPSLTASRTDVRDERGGGLRPGDTDAELGLDVSWGVSPNLTANLALNPDFSQVEADVAQLDVNNRFALLFPETRPFFLDGADYFTTPIDAVFTRTVADPDVGAKLTGTLGDNAVGAFVAEDAVTNLLFPGPLGSSNDTLERGSRAAVVRYRRSVGEASTLGALATSRSAGAYRNTLAGVDGRVRIGDRHSVTFQYLDTRTRYPADLAAALDQPQGDFGGDALRLEYAYSSRNWNVNLREQAVEPGFRADLGFVTRVDVDQQTLGLSRIWQGGADNWWNRLQLGTNVNAAHDFEGRLLGRGRNIFFAMQGPLQSFVQVGRSSSEQYWAERVFALDGVFVFGQLRPRGGLNLRLELNRGDAIDYANSRLAHELRLAPSLDWNINRHALLRLRHTADRLETPGGTEILNADLTDLRLTWQFDLRSFLRLTLQRQLIERNLAVFDSKATEPQSLTVGTQLLYSYQLNPQTVLYAGYSDNQLENEALPELTRADRTVFLKFSYAWAP